MSWGEGRTSAPTADSCNGCSALIGSACCSSRAVQWPPSSIACLRIRGGCHHACRSGNIDGYSKPVSRCEPQPAAKRLQPLRGLLLTKVRQTAATAAESPPPLAPRHCHGCRRRHLLTRRRCRLRLCHHRHHHLLHHLFVLKCISSNPGDEHDGPVVVTTFCVPTSASPSGDAGDHRGDER